MILVVLIPLPDYTYSRPVVHSYHRYHNIHGSGFKGRSRWCWLYYTFNTYPSCKVWQSMKTKLQTQSIKAVLYCIFFKKLLYIVQVTIQETGACLLLLLQHMVHISGFENKNVEVDLYTWRTLLKKIASDHKLYEYFFVSENLRSPFPLTDSLTRLGRTADSFIV
jgi:hypothetical protein